MKKNTMKDNVLYFVVLIAVVAVFAVSATTDFTQKKPVNELWISDMAVSENLTFTVNINTATHGTLEIYLDDELQKSVEITASVIFKADFPVEKGKHKVSALLFDKEKKYDEFGSKAKPYYVFFRVEVL
jgi:hypothetical protein